METDRIGWSHEVIGEEAKVSNRFEKNFDKNEW